MLGAVWAHLETGKGLCCCNESTSNIGNGSRATGALHCPHTVSLFPFPSILPAPKSGAVTAPEDTASAELWWVHAFIFRGMQNRASCPDSFSALSFSICGKQTCKEWPKGQRFQVLFPECVAPTNISCPLQWDACASSTGCPAQSQQLQYLIIIS